MNDELYTATTYGVRIMIVCDRHGFAFIHIPKCAGSSVRQQIASYDHNDGFFSRVKPHPALGKADYGHLTLAQLREHFPEHHARIRRLDCYAICRDPLSRFGSALRQMLWMYDKRPMTLVPHAELESAVRRVIDELDANFDSLSHRHVFFTPQTAYVFDQGERVVGRLFPIEATDAFIAEIGRRVGARLDPERRSNRNVELRYKKLGPVAFRVNALLRRTLPAGAHERIKRLALGVVAAKETAAEASGLIDMPIVRDFVATRYAEDAALHRLALDEHGVPAKASA